MFCWNCGLPQVVLSEELREGAAEQQRLAAAGETEAAADPLAPPPPGAIVWRGAIVCAMLAGGVAAALTLLSLAVPPVIFFSWLWAVGAPVIALGVYSARFGPARIAPGFGARLGLLCGLFITLGIAAVNTVALVLSRFAFHGTRQFDGQLAAFYAQVSAATVARSGAEAAAPFVKLLSVPEFRAGILLCSMGIFIALYLVFSAAGGAFAGLLRARNGAK